MSAKFPYLSKLGLLWKALTACAVLALALFPARPATSTTQLPQQSRAPAKSKVKVPQRPRLIRLVIPKRPYKASDYALPKDVSIRISGQRIVAVKTSPTRKDRHAWQALIGTRYHSGNVDGTDVSPQLWRKLTLLMHKADGSPLTLELLRPLWWLKRHRAAIGRSITLSLDEMGVRGKAILLKIAPCEADSRLLQAGEEIVTGKFVHVVQQVLHLSFEGSTKPLRVTPNHLLFAPERQAWIAAAQLRIGETLLRSNGQRHKLVARKLVRGTRKVYNLETHRAHRYFVTQSKLLVHNSCDDVLSGSGPTPGVIEVSDRVKSVKAFQEYNPKAMKIPSKYEQGTREFVFDAENNRFLVGLNSTPRPGQSPHQALATFLDVSPDSDQIVGGMYSYSSRGRRFTNEHSGHYGRQWTPAIRKKFVDYMQNKTGVIIDHSQW